MADIKEVKNLGKALGQLENSVGDLGGTFGQVFDQSKLIYDKYKEWSEDIYESNRTTWNTRDEAILKAIGKILEEQIAIQKAIDLR